jgi:quinol monooxygenase YgiN
MTVNSAEFGAVLQLRALPGRRADVVSLISNYANTLDGEPGTVLFAAAVDPGEDDIVWMWEEFADAEALQAHFAHDFFRALQLELAELLIEPPAARPLAPFVRRVNPEISA